MPLQQAQCHALPLLGWVWGSSSRTWPALLGKPLAGNRHFLMKVVIMGRAGQVRWDRWAIQLGRKFTVQ